MVRVLYRLVAGIIQVRTSNNKWSKTWSKFSVSFNFFMSFASSLSGSNLIM